MTAEMPGMRLARAASVFDGLLPDDFAIEVGDPREPAQALLPAEQPLVARAVERRRREFARGRECARAAMARFGVHRFALLAGAQREPLWPAHLVGSISHVDRLCAAAVGPAEQYLGVGIDIEHARPLERAVTERVVFPTDRVSASFPEPALAAALIFSAKEAFYKCQFRTSGRFLNFSDVSITLESDFRFEARPCVEIGVLAGNTRLRGRWREHAGLFLTAICMSIT